jgi:hypothetical protein
MNFCSQCGNKLAKGMIYCVNCGSKVTHIEPTIQDKPSPPVVRSSEGIIENEEKGLFDGRNGKRNKAVALGLAILLVGLVFIGQDNVGTVDLYVTYGAVCRDCDYVTADLDLPNGDFDSVIGFPDADGYVYWDYSFSIEKDALDEILWAYIIASHEEGSGTLFSTFIEVDDFPRGVGEDHCLLDSDMGTRSSSGSGKYFTYESYVNNC